MNRRLDSESRQPGMQGNRLCFNCGARLSPDGNCACRPTLSDRARVVGEMRRQEREQIEQAERQIHHLEILIRRLDRRLP
jgi:hypothetical protein